MHIIATEKVSYVIITLSRLRVSGARAPLGPTVDTPLNACIRDSIRDIHNSIVHKVNEGMQGVS